MDSVAADTLYDLLGVPRDTTADRIRSAYRALSKRYHPDRGGTASFFRQLQDAYEVLSDPTRRAEYDRSLRSNDRRRAAAKKSADKGQRAARAAAARERTAREAAEKERAERAAAVERERAAEEEDARRRADEAARAEQVRAEREEAARRRAADAAKAAWVRAEREKAARHRAARAAVAEQVRAAHKAQEDEAKRKFAEAAAESGDLDLILGLTPTQFEYATAAMLRMLGMVWVKRVGSRRDLEVDFTAQDADGRTVIVQCKRCARSKKIGSPELQKFIDMARAHHRVDLKLSVTTSDFTDEARRLGKAHGVRLMNGSDIEELARRQRGKTH